MCLVGHIVDDIEYYSIAEYLLNLPMDEKFQVVSGDLSSLEGCYLYFDRQKKKWIRSGKTLGDGIESNFEGRGATHTKKLKVKRSDANTSSLQEVSFQGSGESRSQRGLLAQFEHVLCYGIQQSVRPLSSLFAGLE